MEKRLAGCKEEWSLGQERLATEHFGRSTFRKHAKQLNLKVKFRESFRHLHQYLREKLTDWFDLKSPSPYMLFVAKLNNNKRVKSKKIETAFGIEL